jgi:hypothetical protein
VTDDTRLLEALDRRARAAVDAVDDAVRSGSLPGLPVRTPPRRWGPLLVAAALVVVALVGAGLLLADPGEDESTTAGERELPVESGGDLVRLALADPASHGYVVRAAFEAQLAPPDGGAPVTVHGPLDLEDPWTASVLSARMPFDDERFIGQRVDVGGPDAVALRMGQMTGISWPHGDEALRLWSSSLDLEGLLTVGRAAVADGWRGEGPLPGHRVLRQGPGTDLSSDLEFAAAGAPGWAGIAYEHAGGDRDFIIGWRRGDETLLRSLHVHARWRWTEIGDTPAIASDGATDRASFASWRTDGGTIMQVTTYGDLDALLEVLPGALRSVDAEEHRALVSAHPPPEDAMLLDRVHTFGDEGGELVAQLATTDPGGDEHRIQIFEQRGGYAVMVELDDGRGISGSGGPLPDLHTPFLQASRLDVPAGPRQVVVAGILPVGEDDVASLSVVDRTTGATAPVRQVGWGGIPGSSQRLVLALIEAEPRTARLDVTVQTDDGELRWRL